MVDQIQNPVNRTAGVVPLIQSFKYKEWTIFSQDLFFDFLSLEGKLSKKFETIVDDFISSSGEQNNRKLLDFYSVLLSGSLFFEKKIIRIHSPNLNNELLLIHELNRTNHPMLNDVNWASFLNHVEETAGMDINRFSSTSEEVNKKYNLINLDQVESNASIKSAINVTTGKLLGLMGEYKPGLFERISDYALNLTAKFALLRIHLLKFIAILPSLDHDEKGTEVKRILVESLRRLCTDSNKSRFYGRQGESRPLPLWLEKIFQGGLFIIKVIPAYILASAIRWSVKQMAKRFIAGESINHVSETFKELKETRREATLDQLGELVVSEKEADEYKNKVIELILGLGQHYQKGEKNKALLNRSHVSIKVSALCSDFKPEAYEYTKKLVAPRLAEILKTAKKEDVFINIDAEHYHYRDLVFKIYSDVLLETPELSDYNQTGVVLQAYLRDAGKHFDDILSLAKERGIIMPVRLVKGAYWDAETIEAEAHSHDAPEFLNKEETDINFRALIYKMLSEDQAIQLCLASHNYGDHIFSEILREKVFPNSSVIEHQCLHMTYEGLSIALSKMGWVTRNYMPVGSLLVGMAYLVRRIMENSSQVGVLTIMRSHKNKAKVESPQDIHLGKKVRGELTRDIGQGVVHHHFKPLSPLRPYLDHHYQEMKGHLDLVKNHNPLIVKNSFPVTGDERDIFSNSDLKMKVGKITNASTDDVAKAVDTCLNFYNSSSWSTGPYIERCIPMLNIAGEMSLRRCELATLIVIEAGKTMIEALADVDEAVDFLNFYAREEGRYLRKNPGAASRGVMAVVTPWNFPLAIPCGMVSAALVAGNSVILKSAEQTPIIASVMVEIFHRQGVPKDALIHLPGDGETVGDALVNHPDIAGVVFTGSKKVGLYLSHTLGKKLVHNARRNLNYPSKVITEMGGKNAIVVTANAELDETVAGILYSAFAHAGQKCSAASRVIVHESILAPLKERLKEAIIDIRVGKRGT